MTTTKKGDQANIYVAGPWAFIPTTSHGPNRSVLYIKVPSCVVYVDCKACGASIGERCIGARGPTAQVHVGRKKAARYHLRHRSDVRIKNCGPVKLG